MSKERDCAEYIRKMIGNSTFNTYLVKVISVEGATCTVERVMDGMIIKDVRLNANITEQEGLVIVPKTDSYILITDIDGDKWFVSQYSQIDSITLDVENDIIINGGENDGLVKVIELTEKLNNIEKDINALKQAFTTWVPAVYDGGAALKAAASSWAAKQLTETQQKDIENELIKH